MIKHQASEAELSWRFSAAGAEMGFRTTFADPDSVGGGGRVSGDDRKSVLIVARYGKHAAKAMRIDASLGKVSADDRALFEDCFAPRVLPPIPAREPDPDGKVVARIGLFAARQEAEADADKRRSDLTSWLTETSNGRHVCVVGALHRSRIAARAFAQAGGGQGKGPRTVAEYLTTLSADNASLFKRIREEVLLLLDAAVARYAVVRIPAPRFGVDHVADSQGPLRGATPGGFHVPEATSLEQ